MNAFKKHMSKTTASFSLLLFSLLVNQFVVANELLSHSIFNGNTIETSLRIELESDILFKNSPINFHNQNHNFGFNRNLPTAVLKERIIALNARTAIPITYNESLEVAIAAYLKRNTKSVENIITSGNYYFPMMDAMLDNHGVPREMKYLAVIESSLNPKSKGPSGATGLWQFMDGTGKLLGLEANAFLDERMDPVKSTAAACKYLKKLYGIYNDWNTVIVAYNIGSGNVSRVIKANGGNSSYDKISKQLPSTGRNYLEKFQAAMYVFEHAQEHGYQLKPFDYQFTATDTIIIKNKGSLKQIALKLHTDYNTLQFLNPSFKTDLIPATTAKPIIIRYLKNEIVRNNNFEDEEATLHTSQNVNINSNHSAEKAVFLKEQKNNSDQTVNRKSYTVVHGDGLWSIAQRNGVTVSDLIAWNKLENTAIKQGQTLYLSEDFVTKDIKPDSTIPPQFHTVIKGDTFYNLSKKYGLTIAAIKQMNPQVTELHIGTNLRIN